MRSIFVLVLASWLAHVGDCLSTGGANMNRRQVVQSTVLTAGGILLPRASPAQAATASISPIATLSDGTTPFPLASFGLQIYDDATAYQLTLLALEVGYRNFFASVLAGNQRGFAKAVRDSGIARSDLFICGSVVSNRASGFDDAKKATTKGWKQNMEAFGVGGIDYLDQIMLDYPGPDCESIQGQWAAFEDMYDQKLTKTLSVSNFSPAQLDCVLKYCKVKPLVNQLPYNVGYHNPSVVEENFKRGLLVQAWAPLGKSLGGRFTSSMKGECATIGKQYNKSYAQVALRWIVQTGASFTTQSKNKQHFTEDLDIFDFELTAQEMATLTALA
jgi:2,5-diketo-D-gluconate reductase A